MSQPIIQLENVNLYYDKGKPSEVWALRNINMEVQKGEYVAFFGPSGCGKTTLLYVLSGIETEKVGDGKVLINNRDIGKFSSKEFAIFRQMGVGIVFQQFNLIPSISVIDNVSLPMAFLGISPTRRKEEAMRLLERLDIASLADRLPHELSGGQQQRVGIARALANNPPIIVADEPLGNLDSENANKVLEFLKELNEKDGRTIIMVTHEAWSLKDAKKIFYMKDGEIIKTETPKSKTEVAKSASSHLYKQLYPDLSDAELMAKSFANLFLRGYSINEVKRFEFFLNQRLKNNIDADIFCEVLDRPYNKGGVGLWRTKAEKVSLMIEELIAQKRGLEKTFKELEQNPEMPIYEEVRRLRDWLSSSYKGKLPSLQMAQMDELIHERLRNIITMDNFRRALNLSKNKFGIGLSMRASQQISEKLESLLSPGIKGTL